MKNLEKREVRSHNIHLYSPSNGIIKTTKCAEVRALFARNKVRFARAEQLCFCLLTRL